MYIYSVYINQFINNECGDNKDESFTEYCETLQMVKHIIERFEEPEQDREIVEIKITRIWVQIKVKSTY